jgi:hypothetical protein
VYELPRANVVGVTDIETAVGATNDVNPGHTDDDAIVVNR